MHYFLKDKTSINVVFTKAEWELEWKNLNKKLFYLLNWSREWEWIMWVLHKFGIDYWSSDSFGGGGVENQNSIIWNDDFALEKINNSNFFLNSKKEKYPPRRNHDCCMPMVIDLLPPEAMAIAEPFVTIDLLSN